jgi:hypothetical protein
MLLTHCTVVHILFPCSTNPNTVMKKTLSTRHVVMLIAIVIASACQKEILNDPGLTSNASAGGPGQDNSTGCRLTTFDFYSADGDYHQTENYVYKNGRAVEWHTWWGGLYKMEYNDKGKLIRSWLWEGGVLINTIDFIYEKDKVVHEIWFDGGTSDIADEVYYTYNTKGEMVMAMSTVNDYTTINTFTANGDQTSWFVSFGGLPYVKGEYVYTKQIRNPLSQRPGIEYEFPYINPSFITGNSWIASEKITYFDEAGNPFVSYEADPLLTKWHLGYQQFPTLVEYIEKNTGGYSSVTMVMENCGQENAGGSTSINQGKSLRKIKPGSPGSIRALSAGPRRGLKQRLAEFQKQIK